MTFQTCRRIHKMHLTIMGMITVICLVGTGCRDKVRVQQEAEPESELLAQVFHYKLYYEDIRELLQGYSTPEDSVQQVRSITEHWVRDRLLLVEAEKNFPKEINLDKLLEDYRQSLLRHFFEQRTLADRLDTVITEQALQTYYEENKEQHRLQSGIFRGYYFKIPRPQQRNDKIRQWWPLFPEKHYRDVMKYASEHAVAQLTDTTEWHEQRKVIQYFPENTLTPSLIRSHRGISREDQNYIYLLYPLEVYHEDDIAPLDWIREQAARFILHQRELKILDQIKEEIYNRDIKHDRVKIFTP